MKKADMKASLTSRRSRNGSFSAGLIAIVLAILVIVNVAVSFLPDRLLSQDTSGIQLYQISDTSREVTGALDKNVKIILISQDVDERISKFTHKYKELSDHLSVETVDPVRYPSILTTYEASDNSIVVVCEETGRQQVISMDDVIVYDQLQYLAYGQMVETAFDADGQLTSAVAYVTSEVSPKVYLLSGHSETALSETLSKMVQKNNVETENLNLMTAGGTVPADCAELVCVAPTTDLGQDELSAIRAYLAQGGSLVLLYSSGSMPTDLPNFTALATEYGIQPENGFVGEQDANRYYSAIGNYGIFPTINTGSDVTANMDTSTMAMMLYAHPMEEVTPARDSITVTPILTSSESSLRVVSEDDVSQGSYLLAAAATEETEGGTARVTVISTDSLISATLTDNFSNLANLSLFMNMLTAGLDDVTNISIPSVSLQVGYNTVTSLRLWSALFVAVIPLALVAVGFVHWLRRRKL